MVGNDAYYYGGAAYCDYESYCFIINNTFSLNQAYVGGGVAVYYAHADIRNSIFWADTALSCNEVSGFVLQISFCDVQDTLWPGEGNISVDPLFRDPQGGDFHLMSTACGDPFDSPCIDAGDPAIFDYLLDCGWGLGTERSDMGAYGGQAIPTDVKNHERSPDLPSRICLSQNYPNPFNSSTVIDYSLTNTSYVAVSIYNILGQLETTIFEGIQQAGMQSVVWDAADFPSGIYFARVETGNNLKNIKMTLLK